MIAIRRIMLPSIKGVERAGVRCSRDESPGRPIGVM